MKLPSVTRNLIDSHKRLSALPYGRSRNRALSNVQRKLESRGLFNRHGRLVCVEQADILEGQRVLSAGGVK